MHIDTDPPGDTPGRPVRFCLARADRL